MKAHQNSARPAFWLPLAIIVVASLGFRFSGLDLRVANCFWQGGWELGDFLLFRLLYDFGTMPALVVSIGALLVLMISGVTKTFRPYRPLLAFLVLVMIAGPGIVINAIFKDHFGRPRPTQIVTFGGDLEYLPLLTPGESGQGKSFPSGHASMGFYFVVFYFVYFYRNRKVAFFWLAFGILFGITIGLARIAQGGHFVSDVFWSGAFVYLTAWGLYTLLSRRFTLKLEAAAPSPTPVRSTL